MSHIVTIKVQVKDATALAAACRRLGLGAPVEGDHRVFGQQVQGHGVTLPGWSYPVVFNLVTGEGKFDNYNGAWGDQSHLDGLLQAYGVELAKTMLRKKGFSPRESLRSDGSIQVTCTVQ